MKPLCIQANVTSPVSIPFGYLNLDSLLAYAVALEEGIPMAFMESEIVPIEIPVDRSPCGRYHLISASELTWAEVGRKYTQRRFPIEHAQGMSKMRRVQITAGPCKSYRVPYEVAIPEGPLTWWAIGDPVAIRRLLGHIHFLGKKRSVGNGQVSGWDVREVEESEVWPGFPVMRDGFPLRHLPIDMDGVHPDAMVRIGNLSYPYWLKSQEQEVFAPDASA